MHAKLMRADRGQAIFETVIFLPMFLFALFGIMWAVQAAVQYERVESAVRYNGLISQAQNPYTDYSLAIMYKQLGLVPLPQTTCTPPILDPLADAAPTFTTGGSARFWSPPTLSSNAQDSSSCYQYGAKNVGIIGIAAGTGLNQDVLLRNQGSNVSTSALAFGPLASIVGSETQMAASGMFFKTVGVNVILACYPSLNTQIQSSLEYATDTSAATMPAPLGTSVQALTPGLNTACTTW